MMNAYQALSLMIGFGMFVLTLISLIIVMINTIKKDKN